MVSFIKMKFAGILKIVIALAVIDRCKALLPAATPARSKISRIGFSNQNSIKSNALRYSYNRKCLGRLDAISVAQIAAFRTNDWFIWMILSLTSTFGVFADKTKLGSMLSSPLVTMFFSLFLCNIGIIPSSHGVYSVVLKQLVPLAIPLLLLDADIRKCVKSTGSLLKAFFIGAIGTIIGTAVAYFLVPMKSIEGAKNIAAALCARHIGGAVNFVAVSDILKTPPDLVAAAMAADNLVVALYFAFLFAISVPDKISLTNNDQTPPSLLESETDASVRDEGGKCPFPMFSKKSEGKDAEVDVDDNKSSSLTPSTVSTQQEVAPNGLVNVVQVGESIDSTEMERVSAAADNVDSLVNAGARSPPDLSPKVSFSPLVASARSPPPPISLLSLSGSLSIAMILCSLSELVGMIFGVSPLVVVSLLTVVAATSFPVTIGSFSPAGGALGVLIMQFFFSVTGAMGHVGTVFKLAPTLFAHTAIQICVHFVVAVYLGKMFKLPFKEIVLASNANVGGPTTAAAMASSKRWKALVLPALLTGVFGYAIATGVGLLMARIL